MNSQLRAALSGGATLVTANRRLARRYRQKYDAAEAREREVWPSPTIVPWSSWLDALWQELLFAASEALPVRLGEARERLLWENVIENSDTARRLLQPAAAADAVAEAWALCRQWRLALDEVEAAGQDDARAFVGWAREFERRCTASNWIADARVADFLREHLPAAPPRRILLAGFDEMTPQQRALVEALRAAGSELTSVEPSRAHTAAHVVRTGCTDAAAELEAAARWARALVEADESVRAGIVVPDLSSRRAEVERVFNAVLAPGGTAAAGVLNISAGLPLASYPVVAAALTLLELAPDEDDWDRVSRVLRSAYLAGAVSERAARARRDADLRARGAVRVKLDSLADEALGAPRFARTLQQWRTARRDAPARQMPSAWPRTLTSLLDAAGWPGEQSLSSAEFQAAGAFKEALAKLAALDLVSGPLDLTRALRQLRQLTAEPFQPESPEAVIEVLGALEAAGMEFDALWVAGLDDEKWPPAPRPNPFLPPALQRQRNLPHASPERELRFARLVTERLCASAPDVVLSWPQRDGDRELAVSPLIRAVPVVDHTALAGWAEPLQVETVAAAGETEVFVDPGAPAISGGVSRGGTRIFKLQAECPFHAFAELRLNARALEAPAPGLDPMARGTLVHRMLEEVWGELKTHAALCAASPERLREIVVRAAHVATTEECPELHEGFAGLEEERLVRLGLDWLALETERGPFTVLARERDERISLGGVEARVKVDRIDRLPDGRDIIIDYKTGKASPRDWESDRPSEPQLPLYAVHHGPGLAGVVFAAVRYGESGFAGVYEEGSGIPSKRPKTEPVEPRLEQWRTTLVQLAEQHREGRAEVDPKTPQVCRYCDLAVLCRTYQQDVEDEEEGE